MWIEDAFLQSRKLLTKAEVDYKMTQLLVCNCRALKKDLDLQQNLIKEDRNLINEILVSRYQNTIR